MNTNNIKTGLIKIPGALTSTGGDGNGLVGGVVAYTGDIYDVSKSKNLAAINSEVSSAISNILSNLFSGDYDDLTNKPTLSSVATSGSINDITEGLFSTTESTYWAKLLMAASQYKSTKPWSVAIGDGNMLYGPNTFCLGHGLKSTQGVAIGRYNQSSDNVVFTLGFGTDDDNRKNAITVDVRGNVYLYGVNGYTGSYISNISSSLSHSLTSFVNNLDSRATSLQNTINASSTAWSNLAPATNVTLAAITGLNATNAQDAFSEINTVIAPLRTGSISSTLVSDTNFNATLDQINLSVPYDISAANSSTEYTDLEDALGSNGSNVPQNLRVGGLTVKFVNSDTEEYEQWRLKSSSWSTDTSNWTNSITTRAEGIYWGSDKLTSKINELNDDKSLVGNTNASALESKINALISCINSLVNKVVFYTGTPFALPQELNSQLNLSRYSYSDTTASTALLGSAICGQAVCGNN